LTASGAQAGPNFPEGGTLGDGRCALTTVHPDSVEALCGLVREHVSLGRAIYPQGGCTALGYGGIPARSGVAVDMRGIDKVIDYPFADMTITVQAGVTLSALRKTLALQNQRVLVDAPQPERATLGGIYATNTCSSRRYGAGRPRDQIIGVSFVTSAGDVVSGGGRVVKNVAGYDLPKLLTGSMGTLGIITQITVKVRPIPELSAIAWIPCEDPARLADALDRLNTSASRPIAVDWLNGGAAQTIGAALELPAGYGVLAIGIEDNADSVRWQIDRLKAELAPPDLCIIEGEQSATLWAALTEFQATPPGPISIVANLRPSSAARFVSTLDTGRWSVQVHAGNGILRAHGLGEWALNDAAAEIEHLRAAAVRDGGNLIVPHCPTAWKEQLHVWGQPRSDWMIGERVRAALDPFHAMNPGRFVFGAG
jgi:glycolate oxidase FAD binding subunit